MSLDDQLAQMWAAGATLSEIERSTGVTRGAAIGRICRARKAGDPRFQLRPPKPKPPAKARVLKPIGEAVGNSRASPPPPAPLEPRLLVDLDWRDCRWPVGRDADGRHTFCGQPQVPGRPYCARHCRAVGSETLPVRRTTT